MGSIPLRIFRRGAAQAVRTLAVFAVLGCLALISRVDADEAAGPASLATLKKLSVEELMDLEVTSVSRHPEKLLDAASAIDVITNDDIRRSGATSLPEALRLADNLEVAQKNPHDWGITARGFNTDLANKLLVLIDGRTVYTPLYSGVFWDVQDYLLEDIDRIEVVSGPGSTLWGSNAVNGVINITSKNSKNTQGTYLEAGGGTEFKDFVAGRYGGMLAPDVSFRVYGKYTDRDGAAFPNGTDAPDGSRMGRAGFRIDSNASAGNALTLQGDYYSEDEDGGTVGNSRSSGANVLGRWAHTFSEESDLSLQLYYDRTHIAIPKPTNGFAATGVLADNLDTYDLDFQHRFRLAPHHEVIWGLGYRFTRDRVRNAPTVGFLPPNLDQNLFSTFAQDEIALQKDLTLTIGTKLEHNDYTGLEVEPSIRLQWNFSERQMAWAAISRAVRTPSRIDHDLIEPTGLPAPLPSSILSGGSNFESESVVAYELGYRAQLSTKVTTSASVFFNDYDHVRSSTPSAPFGFPVVFHNNLEGETYGLELSANYQPFAGWRLHAGYDLLKEYLRAKPGTVDFSNAHNETSDPQQQFSVRSSVDLPHRVEFDTALRWVDTLHNNNGPTVGTVPSYFGLDVRLGWHPTTAIELSVVGQNLTDPQHPEYGYPGATRVEIQRSVYGKVTWHF
ncbi:MAG TPA: TonB-dependent receptor [Opitutaceae bacterium]|nr:TonB-dependent receptor [Opitutaceae bacterium]